MPELILGPLLRHVSDTEATLWVETDAACDVAILDTTARTFCVAGHHYALVVLTGLEPGTTTRYGVALDGEPAWPAPGDGFPDPVLRTHPTGGPRAPIRIAFGSCRVSVPHEHPYSERKEDDPRGREVDALWALVRRMRAQEPEDWPDVLLLLGDQVYADEVSPATRELMLARRRGDEAHRPPDDEVADFEDYTTLYRESWSDPALRWLLSVVSVSMIFDDHDVHDDWNTSETWVAQMHATPWWRPRIEGAYMSYWLYQHLGNLSPARLADEPTYQRVLANEGVDAEDLVRSFARRAEQESHSTRWSFRRDLGATRIVMLDSRAGRQLREGHRQMLADTEWAWVEEQLAGDYDHLVIGTSLPFLLAPGLHHLEAASEAICGGAWGAWAARQAEKVRQGLDLEHWAAFGHCFAKLTDVVEGVAHGRYGTPPASVVLLSGDVHHAYVAEARLPRPASTRVLQAVCSPVRNPLNTRERRALRSMFTRPAARATRLLARRAGVPDPRIRWSFAQPPTFDNQIAELALKGDQASIKLEKTMPEDWRAPILHESLRLSVRPR